MNKNIVICGATGFVGKNLVLQLSKKYKIIGVYNRKPSFKCKNVLWVKADLRKIEECNKVTKKVDILIQAAATTSGSKDIINKPYLHVTDNAIMNSNLLKSCFDNKVKHFIFTSCTVMYGNSMVPLNENQVIEKKIYKNYFGVANTKLYIEKICKFYSDISKTKFSIIRHSNLYGPHDKFDLNKGHFIGSSILKVHLSKNEIDIFGKGNERRDYLFINDFIDFVKKIIKKQKNNYEIYNCSYGKSYPIKEILKKIINLSGMKKKINHLSGKNLNINIAVSNKKAKKEIQWRPTTKLDKGLKKTINWFKKNEKFLQK